MAAFNFKNGDMVAINSAQGTFLTVSNDGKVSCASFDERKEPQWRMFTFAIGNYAFRSSNSGYQ